MIAKKLIKFCSKTKKETVDTNELQLSIIKTFEELDVLQAKLLEANQKRIDSLSAQISA